MKTFRITPAFYNIQLLLPWDHQENWLKKQQSWGNHCGQLFVQLNDKADLDKTTARIKQVPTPYIKEL